MMSLFQSQNDVLCKDHFDVDVWYFFDMSFCHQNDFALLLGMAKSPH